MKNIALKKAGIWFLAFSLFAFHLLFRTVAHADAPSPVAPTFCQSGQCHISFPTEPQLIQQTVPLADGVNRLSYDVYLSPFEDRGVFLLLIATYPTPLTGGNEVAGLEGLLSGIVNHHPENRLIFANLMEMDGRPAMTFLVEGGGSYFRGQALMVGNKLYLIAMEGIKGKMDEKVYAKFLKSFKLK